MSIMSDDHYGVVRDGIAVKISKISPLAITPKYATEGSACADLYSISDDGYGHIFINHGEVRRVQTGLIMEIPKGYELQIRSRSGLAGSGIVVANSPGTIDSDYRGEVCILLTNIGQNVYKLPTLSRVAQCKLERVQRMTFDEIDNGYISKTKRGTGGFGSTGTD